MALESSKFALQPIQTSASVPGVVRSMVELVYGENILATRRTTLSKALSSYLHNHKICELPP
jgi:hypothetical protein